jgi:hypothetical protein
MRATIIGIDCATRANKVGLALATFFEGRTAVDQVRLGAPKDPPSEIVAEWLEQRGVPVLLALDAPLGWPAALAPALSRLRAGAELPEKANDLFRRETDRFIRKTIHKQSLDVGADRIARTAHGALGLLSTLRQLGASIPLAWSSHISGVSAIEVYPAATLKANGVAIKGKGDAAMQQIIEALGRRIQLPSNINLILENKDALDAVTCVLAGHDFLNGQALHPEKPALAEQEGWIWVRDPRLVRELQARP